MGDGISFGSIHLRAETRSQVGGVLAFLDPLLRRATTVVELHPHINRACVQACCCTDFFQPVTLIDCGSSLTCTNEQMHFTLLR